MGKYVRHLPGLLLFAVLFFASNIQAQGDCSERYRSKSFNAIQIFRNVVYSKNAPTNSGKNEPSDKNLPYLL
jgi:hypothetical protein